MPQGCATWPALWENDDTNWQNSGEVSSLTLLPSFRYLTAFNQVDIIEGVNNVGPNMTLHTSADCTMPASRAQTGQTITTDCYAYDSNNVGCAVAGNKADSYGPSFNSAGGGWYVLERTDKGLSIWFWSRKVC